MGMVVFMRRLFGTFSTLNQLFDLRNLEPGLNEFIQRCIILRLTGTKDFSVLDDFDVPFRDGGHGASFSSAFAPLLEAFFVTVVLHKKNGWVGWDDL